MTFAPTYRTVGLLAPLVVLVSRLLQGFSVGGEFGPSTALLVEVAPAGSKGIYGSWQMTGQVGANLLSAGVGVLLTTLFTREQLMAGAWRLAFAVGLIIAPIAVYIRKRLVEAEEFQMLLRNRAASSTKDLGIARRPATEPPPLVAGVWDGHRQHRFLLGGLRLPADVCLQDTPSADSPGVRGTDGERPHDARVSPALGAPL